MLAVDDIHLASTRASSANTIRQPLEQMVNTTVELLFQQIDNPSSAAKQRVLPNDNLPSTNASFKRYAALLAAAELHADIADHKSPAEASNH